MTRFVARILNVGPLVCALLLTSTALLGQTGTLALSSGSVAAGGSITLNLNWVAPAANVPAGLQWAFTYTPSDISSITMAAGPALTAAGKTLSCNATSGTTICLATGMNADTIGSGVLATVSVVLASSTPSSSVPIANGNLAAVLPDGTSSSIAGTGGTIGVLQPVPLISSLLPSTALSGGLSFTLTVNGSGFTPASVVNWNAAPRATTFVSATQLRATVTALDILLAILAQVTVSNPAPGGGTSGNAGFTVNATNAVPAISSLSPANAIAGTAAFTLTVNGTGFLNGSIVRWNGTNRTTTFVSAAQLQAAITAADIATAGTAQLTVFNPAPGGGTSSNAAFSITATNPVPTISSLSPLNAMAGTAAFSLTVNGTGFLNGSMVKWNGTNRTTTFVSATQLQAAITAADITTAGTGQVTVFNPAPGGGTSGVSVFTINAPTPPPAVSITTPIANATVSSTITVTATAASNIGIADVQFQLDGVNVGADLTAAPYSISWNTTSASNATHSLTAIARDTAHTATASTAVLVTVNNAAGTVPTAGLIGYWNYDEAAGAIAHDTSGGGYDGTVVSASWAVGKINSGLSLNGISSYVVTPNIPLSSAFSISTWVNSAVTTQAGYTRIAETQYSWGFYLGTNDTGTKFKFIVNSGNGSTGSCGKLFGCAEGAAITTGWHLVTGTFDGSTARLYVDNVLIASDTVTTPINTSFPLYIGRNFGGNVQMWNGGIDEVRLYNRALTGAEVSAIFGSTGGTGGTDDTAPPTISITSPTANATVSATIAVTATAADNVGVSDVQFQLDGVNVGSDMTASPYSMSWNTTTSNDGMHRLTAIARDAAHNATTSTTVQVMVSNVTAPTAGLIGYWNFDEGSGTLAHDTSGSGFNGAVNAAVWSTGKTNAGLTFNGTSSYVVTPNIPLSSAFSVSTWVNSAITTQGGYTRIAETQYSWGFYLGTNDTGTKFKFIVNSGNGSTGSCGKLFGCAEGAAITTGWHLVTGTFDGSTARLYVDNVLVASDTFTTPINTSFPLYIGRNFGGNVQMWNGGIDEVRLYNRALTGGEVSAIFGSTGGTTDTTAPSTPSSVTATAISSSQVNISWAASTDNVGVTGYRVYRNGTMVGTSTTLSYSDTGLTASTSYSYTVMAIDAAGNASTPSTAVSATTQAALDTTPPTISITSPTANATVSATIAVTATAADNVGVSDVQFQLDGVNVGSDMTASPYSMSWNTTTSNDGMHRLTAIARDAAHNATTSTTVQVMVSNVTAPTAGLIGYWNFDEGSGTLAHDTSGSGFNGAVNAAVWSTGKTNAGLTFNGTSSYVVTPNIPLSSAFSVSTWVNSAITTQGGYTRIAETQYSWGFYLGTNDTGTKFKFIVNSGNGSTGSCGKLFGCAEGAAITTGWHLVTGTFDGSTARLYVDNVLVASDTFTTPINTSFPLYIGRNFGGNVQMWNGGIDEVRLYNRAITGTEVSTIFAYTGGPTGGPLDITPPSTPTGVFASAVSSSQINVAWGASSDNVGVTGYRVFRNGTLVGAPAALSYSDTGLAASTSYSYTVTAVDAAGNASTPSTAASVTTPAPTDTMPPNVSITTPAANGTVSATTTVTASAGDNVGVADVQFQLDGVNLGADLTAPPYSISWNTSAASDGTHNLTAIARDAAHNATTSTVVLVTVNNAAATVPTAGLIGYWNFDEGTGTTAHDASGSGYDGTVNALWTAGKMNSGLSFNGTSSYVVTPTISLNAFSVSTWVNPAVTTQFGYTRIAETQYSSGFYLGVNSTGTKFKFIVNSGSGSTAGCGGLAFGCAEGGALTSGWHLVTGTYDGVTAKLYVDNVLVASDTFTPPHGANFPLYIGRYFAGSGFNWNGGIDEVRLYNRALTFTEVGAIFSH